MRPHRRAVALATAVGITGLLGLHSATAAQPAQGGKARKAHIEQSQAYAAADVETLQAAAGAVEQEALDSGALAHPVSYRKPARVLFLADSALIRDARRHDPSLHVGDTTQVMGPVPQAFRDHRARALRHARVSTTHTLLRFTHAGRDGGGSGYGLHRTHAGVLPAEFRRPDGEYVEPSVPAVPHPTIAEVALRTAIGRLGLPYVWAAAGPVTFDCSGLVQWAYAHAGIALAHYTGDQWNEGRKIPPQDILPGDLILFGNPTEHVGMYLGAGWMINAPYTGQYVDVVPVSEDIAGIIRP